MEHACQFLHGGQQLFAHGVLDIHQQPAFHGGTVPRPQEIRDPAVQVKESRVGITETPQTIYY